MKRYVRRKYSYADTAAIGQRVRKLRHREGLTQVELAIKAHVSLAMVAKLEAGRYPHSISIRGLDNLARVLKTSIGHLIGESSNDQSLSDMAVLSGLLRVIKDRQGAEEK